MNTAFRSTGEAVQVGYFLLWLLSRLVSAFKIIEQRFAALSFVACTRQLDEVHESTNITTRAARSNVLPIRSGQKLHAQKPLIVILSYLSTAAADSTSRTSRAGGFLSRGNSLRAKLLVHLFRSVAQQTRIEPAIMEVVFTFEDTARRATPT